ncbi:hypothetical protein GGF31_008376 [Allomyces arbusculus]|nr:hypothetical protein GGF31_008376 [Allomyces arbusculus]
MAMDPVSTPPAMPDPRSADLANGSAAPAPITPPTTMRAPKLCTACGLPMTGQFVRALGGTFHLDCFKCVDCGKCVASRFFPVQTTDGTQVPLCERDYFARLDLLCAKCGGALRGAYIQALGRKYHVEHFTCSMCDTVFGPAESYYEHNGAVYCHYHFSQLHAARCTGCHEAILKQFVEIARNGVDEQWHPECYMIHKSWNVTLVPEAVPSDPDATAVENGGGTGDDDSVEAVGEDDEGLNAPDAPLVQSTRALSMPEALAEPDAAAREQLRTTQQLMEEKATRIWSVLSVFEESAAACISDMLLNVSNGLYVEGVNEAASFILHVEVLFAGIDRIEALLARHHDRTGLVHHKEPKLLCKKIVGFFSLLSHAHETHLGATGGLGPRRLGITQELLGLVTSLAHLLKVLIRMTLCGALKLERVYGQDGAVFEFLDTLMELSDHEKRIRMVLLDTDVKSDLCHACRSTIEESCVAVVTHPGQPPLPSWRWHSHCFACAVCGRTLTTAEDVEGAVLTQDHQVQCANCFAETKAPSVLDFYTGENASPVHSDTDEHDDDDRPHHPTMPLFELITPLSQYTFLLRVALKRLLGLLRVEEGGLTDALQDPRRKRVLSGSALDATTAAAASAAAAAAAAATSGSPNASTFNSMLTSKPRTNSFPRSDSLPRLVSPSPGSTPPDDGRPARSDSLPRPGSSPPQYHYQHYLGNIPASTSPTMASREMANAAAASASAPVSPPPPQPAIPPLAAAAAMAAAGAPITLGMAPAPTVPAPEMWLSDLSALEAFVVRHFAARDLEPLLAGIMRPEELAALTEERKSSGSGTSGGMWGRFVSTLRGGGRRKDKESSAAVAAARAAASAAAAMAAMNAAAAAAGNDVPVNEMNGPSDPVNGIVLDDDSVDGDGAATPNPATATPSATSPAKNQGTFGVPLDILLYRTGVSSVLGARSGRLAIPAFIDTCVGTLRNLDLHVEGIFRKNGNIRRLNEVKDALDSNPLGALDMIRDDNAIQIAALLKKFLRELPEPLLTFRLYKLFMAIARIQNEQDRMRALHYAVCLLPKAHRDVLEVLMLCLRDVAAACTHPDDPERGNKMDYGNLATVLSPTFLVPPRGAEEHHDVATSVLFDLLRWQPRVLWTVPSDIAALFRTGNATVAGGGSSTTLAQDPATQQQQQLAQQHELLRRVQAVHSSGLARSAGLSTAPTAAGMGVRLGTPIPPADSPAPPSDDAKPTAQPAEA